MTTTRLNDIQLLLLSTAALRPDGSLLPPADSLGDLSDRIRKPISSLLRRGFAKEVEVADTGRLWRMEGASLRGLAITDAGRTAIGLEMPDTPSVGIVATSPAKATKIGLVTTLLRRDQGATLAELVEATGWLPHTTRAALTGLRKKGHSLAKTTRNDATCYRIAEAA
jgi:hypothetical protein